ncbi:hypothetical protein [Cellulomonas fimi]|uniref:hypothetical protein n=1 Tax=Cellulomonas fimi TaxID=1708 RepID=UPI001575FC43|nr:hypothetical protein [Cellulomonas fimi]
MRARAARLGGALAAGPDDGALGVLIEPYLLDAFGLAHEPGLASAVGERLGRLPADLGDVATGRKPVTFLSPGEGAAAAYSPDAFARLQELKRSRDPLGTLGGAYPLLGRRPVAASTTMRRGRSRDPVRPTRAAGAVPACRRTRSCPAPRATPPV